MFRDLLVHVDASDGGRGRLDYALDMATRFDARLTGIHVQTAAEVPPVFKPSRVGEALKAENARLKRRAEAAADLFQTMTSSVELPVRWRAACGSLGQSVAEAARYADLVIVGQTEHEGYGRHPFTLAEDIVRIAGRPIIMAPAGAAFETRRIAVAWDGSGECVRAVHDALPLVKRAKEVVIITVDGADRGGERANSSARELIDHLGRHDIDHDHVRSVVASGDHTEAILSHLRAGDFDLLVMGAFSRSAWSELAFGGTTVDVLHSSGLPVLIAQ